MWECSYSFREEPLVNFSNVIINFLSSGSVVSFNITKFNTDELQDTTAGHVETLPFGDYLNFKWLQSLFVCYK